MLLSLKYFIFQEHVVVKRSMMVGIGGLCAVLGSEVVGFSGAGPLICITASFVACLCWKIQGWSSENVRINVKILYCSGWSKSSDSL